MKPRRTPLSTDVYRLAGGNEDNDLWAERGRTEDGTPVIISTWELSDDERREIAAGCNIELHVFGIGQPPVNLRVSDVPLGAKLPDDADAQTS